MTKKLLLALAALLAFAPSAPAQTLNKNVQKDASAGTLTESLSTGNKTVTVASGGTINFLSGSTLSVQAGATVTGISGSGTGDVNGPASSTDNAIARFDGTGGKTLQNSSVTISDTGGIAHGSGNLTLQGATSGALLTLGSGSNGSATFTLPGTGLVNIDSSATATQARLNINLLSPGVAATQEAVVSYQAYDSAGNYRQIGAMGAYWVDAGATGYSAVFLHADDYNGGGSNNDVRVSAGHGILLFASDNVFPGPGILEVRGTLNMKGAITTDNNYTATASTPIIAAVSSSASSLAQMRVVNATTRALSIQSFGDSASGTTFGVSNAAAATLTTGTTGSFYPAALLIGTLGSTAPVVFGVNNTEVGRFSSTAFTTAVPITTTGVTSSGNYAATAATPLAGLTSSSATSFSQFQAISTTGRAATVGMFGDSASGTTFGVSNAALAYVLAASTGSNYPAALAIGTVSASAPIVFGVSGSEVGRFTTSLLDLAVPVETTEVRAASSAGLSLKNSGGTEVLLLGAGPGTGATFAGGVVITGTGTVGGANIITTNNTETLTNKTISGASNTLTVRLANDVTGTLPVANGGTGATTLTGYLKGNGTSAVTASATVPAADVTAIPDVWIVAASDETTALTTGTAKVTFRAPYAATVTAVRATLTTAQSAGSIFTVDINDSGTSILSTKLTVDNTEKTSTTAATPPVISDTAIADDAEITIDIDQVGTSGATGLKVYIAVTR
jgi:hypothetical protein